MNSWDKLRSEERRIVANTWARRLWPFGLALLTFAWGFVIGVRRNAPSEQSPEIAQALEDNGDSLRRVRAVDDSLKHADSLASAIATTSRLASANHRPLVDSLGSQIHTGQVGDSLVVLERPAGGANDSARVDSLRTLPLPIVSFIREAKIQLVLDSTTIHDLTVSNEVKDGRIANLERADSLSQHRDSLHVVREGELEAHARSEFWRGVKTGAKTVLVTAALIGGAVKLVRSIPH